MKIRAIFQDMRLDLRNRVASVSDRRPSVLVLHDVDGWALDHVFELWFGGVQPVRIVRRNWAACSTLRAFRSFDAIVFGYLDIYLRYGFDPARSIVVIHDPCELFPQSPDWKSRQIDGHKLRLLKTLRGVVVISREMEGILTEHGLKVWRVPTMSRLPAMEPAGLKPIRPVAISVYRDYPRKNIDLLRWLQRRGEETGKWLLRLHENPRFSDTEYIRLVDQSPVYICTSWQEGGPLPAMDVMGRGGVVVSTPVGQVQEMITDGESGFICSSAEDFEKVLGELFADPVRLLRIRKNSLAAYHRFRDKEILKSIAIRTLGEIQNTIC